MPTHEALQSAMEAILQCKTIEDAHSIAKTMKRPNPKTRTCRICKHQYSETNLPAEWWNGVCSNKCQLIIEKRKDKIGKHIALRKQAGETYKSIANNLGMSPQTASDYAKRYKYRLDRKRKIRRAWTLSWAETNPDHVQVTHRRPANVSLIDD